MRPFALVVLACTAACSDQGSDDVVGPFTGEVHTFYVDAFAMPRDASEALAIADDLDGDGAIENAFGNVTAVLATTNDLTTNAPEMIASGALASFVEIQADDLVDDPSVGVRFVGGQGLDAGVFGARLSAGVIRSNRTRDTTHPGLSSVRLPIYTNADPLNVGLDGIEVDLTPDGRGGYDGIVRGGIPIGFARDAAYSGFIQMAQTEPDRHLVFGRGIDTDHDDVFSREELDVSVIAILVSPDIERYASITQPSMSVAFGVHLSPTPPAAGAPTCRDRVKNGDETDVDCGGSCQTCWASKTCSVPADCQSQVCAGDRCLVPTCSDGVRDGYESDVDCGGKCGPCAAGKACAADRDCASNRCDNGVGSLGNCS
ncbi:MAG: hypothetical protein HOV81_36510 [Kofleriaceae bacterium]|nr:hypothetical protein [Kofleriaceae bacterium]